MIRETLEFQKSKKNIYTYTLVNCQGVRIILTNFGAAIYRIQMPDKNGKIGDIALSCDTIEEFTNNNMFFGATVGRVANRVKDGKLEVKGNCFQLLQNEGLNHVHGGMEGFDKKIWNSKIVGDTVEFEYISRDGEEGYPGCLRTKVVYRLTEAGELHILFSADSSKDTVVNLTNHTYFNLGGVGNGSIIHQKLEVNGEFYLQSDNNLIPTGQVLSVNKSPFDFRNEKELETDMDSTEAMIHDNEGYDVTFIKKERGFGRAAKLFDPKTKRQLDVFTDLPSIHLYTGNFLKNTQGISNIQYQKHDAVCLEAQRFPYAMGYSHFGEIYLKQGDKYEQQIVYKFTIKE